jgi:hypothetical protein
MAPEELEERFIKHGTVILFKGGPMLQAVKVRGTARQREVWFAPSSRSSRVRDGAKLKASEVHTSEGVTHVFINVIGAVFSPRLAPGDPPSAMSFKVVSLQASSQAAELETVSLRAIIGGSMVGDSMNVGASTFFLSHVPSVRLQAHLDTPVGDALFGEVSLADEYPALYKSMRALGAAASATYSGAEVAAYPNGICSGGPVRSHGQLGRGGATGRRRAGVGADGEGIAGEDEADAPPLDGRGHETAASSRRQSLSAVLLPGQASVGAGGSGRGGGGS